MLKAYDYVEYSPESDALQNLQYFGKELEIAKKMVGQIEKKARLHICCPVCQSKQASHFCEKWGVEYLHCDACETIYVNAGENELEQYRQFTELKDFRMSEEYQSEAASKREITWEESVDWITFRTFRYIGRNTGLTVLDIGNRYQKYSDAIKSMPLSGRYCLVESIKQLMDSESKEEKKADIVLYLNQIQQSLAPLEELKTIYGKMNRGGLLFFSTRMGTGFDVLTLKEEAKIFPYEHVFLPSRIGMEYLLEEAGFKILEYSTPGRMDVGTVVNKKDKVARDNYFVHSLIKNADNYALAEFQRFLQKSGMSSYSQIVAKKME